jgi:hypothetical protein
MIKYAIVNDKSLKKIRFCMSSKDKKLQKLTERDHVSRHSMCVCVFTLFQMGRWALYDPLKKLFFYFYKAFKTFPLFIFF